MKTITHRLRALEQQSIDIPPLYVWQDGDTPPAIPDHVGNRPVVFVRWATDAEAIQDPARTLEEAGQ